MSRGSATKGRRERVVRPTSAVEQPLLRAAIVSSSRETLDGLESYLRGAGVATRATSQLARLADVVQDASAIVMFPDDFSWNAVVSALRGRRGNASALVVLVTSRPERFASVVWADGSQEPMVVPKPAWGWTILDAIRAHVARDSRARK